MLKNPIVFSGRSHFPLTEAIAKIANFSLGKVDFFDFPDGEIGLQVNSDVTDRTVIVVQSIAMQPHKYLFELLLLVDALKRKAAKKIVAALPYFGYARQDRKNKDGEPISARVMADILQKSGVGHLITLDMHTPQVEGFFTIPVDHLHAKEIFAKNLRALSLHNPVIVSPDIGSKQLARNLAQELKGDIAMIDKRRIDERTTKALALIGDVNQKDVIIIDDICSTGSTLVQAARLLKKKGALRIYAAVSHFLSKKNVAFDGIEKIFTTNSVKIEENELSLEVISIASLFADAMKKFD